MLSNEARYQLKDWLEWWQILGNGDKRGPTSHQVDVKWGTARGRAAHSSPLPPILHLTNLNLHISTNKSKPTNLNQQISTSKYQPTVLNQHISTNKCQPTNINQQISTNKSKPTNLNQKIITDNSQPPNLNHQILTNKFSTNKSQPTNWRCENP